LSSFVTYPYPDNTPTYEYIDYASYDGSVRFSPNEAELYQLRIRTHYYDSSGAGVSYHHLDYDFGTREERTKTIVGNQQYIAYTFRTADYWNAIGHALNSRNPSVNIYGRRAYMIEYIVYSSTQEYIDYLQYASPSFALSNSTPL